VNKGEKSSYVLCEKPFLIEVEKRKKELEVRTLDIIRS